MFKDIYDEKEIRKTGRFYTPKEFADLAHKYIECVFGENWKDEYVVWDNCCGTKNLTKDYNFKELYCSTLENEELELSKDFNKEAVSFQFDFLNDNFDKLPQGLINAFENDKPIIFFINPPYATAGNKNETSKKGCAKTWVNEEMLKNGMGACSQNLYAQFFYRIMMFKEKYNLTNLHIGLFCPTLFLSGSSYKNFRTKFLNEFRFNKAFLFNAGNFANCASSWGIGFSIWNSGVTTDKENFTFDLIDFEDSELVKVDEKVVYNIDNAKTASSWIKQKKVINSEKIDVPHLSNAINVKGSTGKGYQGMFGYYYNDGSNNVDRNTQGNSLFSTVFSNGHGQNIVEDNFTKCTALFSARKLVEKTWINSKDEYLAPNEEHPQYQEFVNDSLIYSLFHSSSNQSSLRQVEYKGKKWDIKNEFFFMGKDEIMQMAKECGFEFTFNDASVSTDRYVYKKLMNITLSEEAKAVLDKANDIVRKTFRYREEFNEKQPKYQIRNWDIGWYQIKALAKEYAKEDLVIFNDLFKKLADKMRPMVYELCFLKKTTFLFDRK